MTKTSKIRVRIAPSPTGLFHIGTARTALFNYLFAKKHKGDFILRIEDTDKQRSKKEFEKDIMDGLKWLGLKWDESYYQSKRIKIYEKYLKKLLDSGKAYKKEIIWFKNPNKKVVFNDLIRGRIEVDSSLLGDFSLAKSLKEPLYNFAAVIDDYEMKISHVIRGEDHISNTPKQILIQETLGLPRPKYAHLPIILGSDRSKLSKRHGAVGIADYRKDGYFPETLVNFMAFLGWNPGGEREIYAIPSLIKEFSLEGVQKGGAIFNVKRLDFLNGFYIRQKSVEKLTDICLPYLIEAGLITPGFKTKQYPPAYGGQEIVQEYKITQTGEEISLESLQKIVSTYKERLKKMSEISELTDFFFRDKLEYDKNLLKWGEMTDKEIEVSLDKSEKILSKVKTIEEWNKENLENILIPEAEKFAKELSKAGDRGYLLWPLRIALTGKKSSAGPFEIAEILGKEKTIKRIIRARNILCARPST
jgi:glutamyl-tRNA synthetase